jgi:hypothetical protein
VLRDFAVKKFSSSLIIPGKGKDMANTDTKKLLKQVRDAETAVTKALDGTSLTQPQRDLLDDLTDALHDLDTFLLSLDLKAETDELKKQSGKLSALNKQAKKKLKKLGTLAAVINDIAVGLDALTQVAKILE